MECKVKKGIINYNIQGDGFPILILHSLGTDHRSMQAWIEPIFKHVIGYQRIYVDIPAHGRSIIDESVTSSDDILTDLLDFVDSFLHNQHFSLLGFSYGGYLSQGTFHSRETGSYLRL